MENMQQVENSILEDLEQLGDVLNRSEFLIRCGKAFEGIPENKRRDTDLIRDCQTTTWVSAHFEKNGVGVNACAESPEDILVMRADSASVIVKGALALIDEIYNGRTRAEIASFPCKLTEHELFTTLFSERQMKGIRSIINIWRVL